MKKKISRTCLVLAAIVVLYFALLGSGMAGSMVAGLCIGATFTVPAVLLGPLKYRVIGIISFLLLASLGVYDYSAGRRLSSGIDQAVQKARAQQSEGKQANTPSDRTR